MPKSSSRAILRCTRNTDGTISRFPKIATRAPRNSESSLRKSSLDELPQLWNVLLGDMSLVGPRPIVEDELHMYGNSADLLLSARPGLTGAWAVSGRHGVGYPERCDIELSYVRHWRLTADLRIVLRTVKVLLDIA